MEKIILDSGSGAEPHITMSDAANELGLTRQRIHQRIKAGEISGFMLAGRLWVPDREIRALLAERKTERIGPGGKNI